MISYRDASGIDIVDPKEIAKAESGVLREYSAYDASSEVAVRRQLGLPVGVNYLCRLC